MNHEISAAMAAYERERLFHEEQSFFESCFQDHVPCPTLPDQPLWLIEGFLPHNYLAILSSKTKEGKSSFLSGMMLAVCKGEPFAGMNTTPGRVLWISRDENYSERREVMKHSPEWRTEDLPITYGTGDLPNIEHPMFSKAVHWLIQRRNVRLIVVDSLYAQTKCDLERHRNARKVMTVLKDIADAGVAVVVLHQERGNDSIQLHATAGMVMHLSHTHTRAGRLVRLACRGRGDFANKVRTFQSGGPLDYNLLSQVEVEDNQPTATEELILDSLAEGEKSFGTLRRATELNRATLRSALNRLLEDGLITYRQEDQHRIYERIPDPDSC